MKRKRATIHEIRHRRWREAAIPWRVAIGDQIRQRRETLGLTQVDLAEKVGANQPLIAHLEQGDSVALRTILAIAKALDLELAVRKSRLG